MVHFFLALPILAVFLIVYKAAADGAASSLWFPLVVAVQFLFTLACALILSALTVHFRDIRDILLEPADALVLRDADHLSRTCSRRTIAKTVPEPRTRSRTWRSRTRRSCSSRVRSATGSGCSRSALASVVLFLAGYWLFDRLRDSFAEEV